MSGGEWREVRRRGVVRPNSERQPVRQPYFPNRRFNPRLHPAGNRNGFRKVTNQGQIPDREGERLEFNNVDGDTFFFSNFPEGCWLETLKRRFNVVGRVIDIFCPKKRDIKGKSFGFVRFEKGYDTSWLLSELNNIWIGSFKLRAYVPRFERMALEKQKQNNESKGFEGKKAANTKEDKEDNHCQEPKKGVECGRTFLEILTGKAQSVPSSVKETHSDVVVSFQSTVGEKEWLTNSFTGYIKTDFIWEEVKDEISSECGSLLKLTSLGGNLVLIRSIDQSPVQALLKELDEWVQFWFEWSRPWEFFDVITNRMVWTKWSGVPLQAWNPRFFEAVGAKMGMVLKLHEDTKSLNRLDCAFIQMSTGLNSLNKIWDCKIDGAHFTIKVEEIGESPPPSFFQYEIESLDSEVEPDKGEEEEDSVVPAMAQVDDGENEKSISGGEINSSPADPSVHAKSLVAFPSPDMDFSKAAPSQSLESQKRLESPHAQTFLVDPLSSVSRSAEADNFLGLENIAPSGDFRPSPNKDLGPREGLFLKSTAGDFATAGGPEESAGDAVNNRPKVLCFSEPNIGGQAQFSTEDDDQTFLSVSLNTRFRKNKKGRQAHHQPGFRRFLSQKIRRRTMKFQSGKRSSDERQTPHTSGSNADLSKEVTFPTPLDVSLDEGLKIWKFGKDIGLSSRHDDRVIAMNIMGISDEGKDSVLETQKSVSL